MKAFSLRNTITRLVLISPTFLVLSAAQDATALATASPTAPASLAPECAASCIQGAQDAQSQCAQTDLACLCAESATIQEGVSSCLKETNACSSQDTLAAVAYYPQFCAQYGLSADSTAVATGSGGIVTAAGEAPPQRTGVSASDLVLTTTGPAVTETVAPGSFTDNLRAGLSVPAILGITLGSFFVIIVIASIIIYSHVRHRQMRRRTRLAFLANELGDQGGEYGSPPVERPSRCGSVQSHFMVQPSPVEKGLEGFDFGLDISRTSTLVSIAPPPPVKVNLHKDLPDIRASTQHIEEASQTDNRVPAAKDQNMSTFQKFRASLRLSRSVSPVSELGTIDDRSSAATFTPREGRSLDWTIRHSGTATEKDEAYIKNNKI